MGCLRYLWAGATLLVLTAFLFYDLVGQFQLGRRPGRQCPTDTPTNAGAWPGVPFGLKHELTPTGAAVTPTHGHHEHTAVEVAPAPTPKQIKIHPSRNWAGAMNSDPPSGRFAAAKMRFTLPGLLRADVVQPAADYYAANAWVGIDGWSHQTAILQAGVVMQVNKTVSDELVFKPWFEWWPEPAVFFDIPMGPGDDIKIEVVMFNATSGKVLLENNSRGEWVIRKLMSPHPDVPLAGKTVEWILEDFKLARGPNVPLGDFGTLELRDCVAYTSADEKVGPDPSQPFWIRQDNVTRARSAVNGSSVTIEYNRSL
ncbi:hypothetical protein KVR01_000707 [Diaporthe batatas]|uniref:uncharacterized protein n=1 Tax=Diaporthe batatas TaxID=748121 RepID=UPI001D05821A|nr:uncharacterized protein KVR01_000707 [Diaporthe batatas]KAG8169962.1 hypothetical protein KVR01_000707 [Diaporthe batatas]